MRSADSIRIAPRGRRLPGWSLALVLCAICSRASAQTEGDSSAAGGEASAPPAEGAAGPAEPATTTTSTSSYIPWVPAPGTNLDAHLPSSSQSKADINQPDSFDLRRSSGPASTVHGNADSLGVLSADTAAGMTPGKGFHIVKKGDTLWGITGEHFEDSRDWPRVWSFNPQLQNPHWIYPGDQLRLGPAVAADATATSAGGIRGGTLGHGLVGRTSLVPPETIFLRELGYIDEPDKDVWGQIVGAREERQLLVDTNHVYMILRPGAEVQVGQQMTVFEPSREPPTPKGARRPPGEIIAFKGTVKIDGWDPEKRVARAEVIESLDVMERGASVGPIGRRHYVVPPAASQVDLRARVLTSMYPHVIMGKEQVVFIDRGENDGLVPGNRLYVVRQGDVWRESLQTTTVLASGRILMDVPEELRFEDTPLEGDDEMFPEEVVGELRVIRTHKFSALALVTESAEEVEPGDVVVARKGFSSPARTSRAGARGLRVMTYNIHACVGADGRCLPERVADVIREQRPDVVALQEVDVGQGRSGGLDQARHIAELTNLSAHFTSARETGGGRYGNAILTHHPYQLQAEGILPVRRGEVRAAQWLRLSLPEGYLDVVNTHLSLHFLERLAQARALFSDDPALPEAGREPAPFPALHGTLDRLILCGDFNSGAASPIYFWLRHRLLDAQRAGGRSARATWPARCPLLRLDHVFVGRALRVERVQVPRNRATRLASDHLPIVVDLAIDSDETAGTLP